MRERLLSFVELHFCIVDGVDDERSNRRLGTDEIAAVVVIDVRAEGSASSMRGDRAQLPTTLASELVREVAALRKPRREDPLLVDAIVVAELVEQVIEQIEV